jgi:Ca2+-transporting ATPase
MAFAAFSLNNIVLGLACRSETETVFNRDTLGDRQQLGLYGLAVLSVLVPTGIGVLQRGLGLTSLTLDQWLLCLGSAVALLLVDEVVKLILRRNKA